MAPDPAATAGFLPHGYCFLWNKPLLWTHVVSDVLIGAAYVTISVSLAWLVHRARRDIPFSAAFVMFGIFIIACGTTHFLEVVTFWHPIYPQLGAVKVVTAIASVATAATMPQLAPRVRATVRDARLARTREVAAARATALEDANAELTRLNGSLQDALAAAERARAEAEAARAAAERANRAKADFLAVMSHELRTPLNAIGGHVQLLEMHLHGPVTDAQAEALGRVQRAQRHLLGLITDVLNHAKLEAGRVEYDVRETSLGDVVRDVVPLLEPRLVAKGLALCVSLSEDRGEGPTLAWADRDKLGQVLLNLLSNAVKFTPARQPTGDPGRVTVAVHASASASVVRLVVGDTGVGVPAEKLDAVFEPFVQVRVGLTREHEGTGLGLAISRDLARGMGGDLTAESVEGAGSTFTVTLRRSATHDGRATERRVPRGRRAGREPRSGHDRRHASPGGGDG